ncbi:Aspartate aminotransferase [Pseudobythopirellula maris]|uniref:Aspartate aminotransferase n=1 Tax=Pseudobythopirellula maris TaxID=2527991 RepID=A0A5C5ZUT5_9BACT|nr:amino acid aminotransferase [Pseudobythopirellula maris]TWT90986.1 Aspartate aminotransferase [Pseudobythopirellula maris]
MFEAIQPAPADPILGLTDAFKADPNPEKINLGVGVYQDANGKTPTLPSVAEAGRRLAAEAGSKSYLPITGSADYSAAVQGLMFGGDHEAVASGRAVTAHTPGGTGALRVTADFIRANLPTKRVWVTTPTWANHVPVFAAGGLEAKPFPYFDKATNGLAFDAAVEGLGEAEPGDAVLLHGCCHNPSGIDPTAEQWEQLADLAQQRGLLPVLDFAYQGFAEGLTEDAAGLRAFCRPGAELIVCNSFSKNFGLYCERVGGVTIVASDADRRRVVESQLKRSIRSNYSNPPAHGAQLVTTVLGDSALRQQWEGELASMRERINGMRSLLVAKLAEHGVPGDYSFIERQRGMFSFSGLTPDQVEALRERHSIYIVGSGRINVAGVTPTNIDQLCAAIGEVVGG